MITTSRIISDNDIASDLLRMQIAEGEGELVEFSLHAHPETIGNTIAAFLNSKGGTLLIGLDDAGNVVGAPPFAATEVKETLTRLVTPLAPISVEETRYEGMPIIVVDVPSGPDGPYLFGEKIYVRHGDQSRPATQKELDTIISRRSTTTQRWERLPALGFRLDDLDEDQIAQTASEAHDRRLYEWQTPNDTREVLERLYLADSEELRNSAIVLFARQPQNRFPQTRIRIVRFASDDQEEILFSRILHGNTFSLLGHALEILISTIPTTSNLPRTGIVRRDIPAYPLPVLREGLVNALVHRDYAAFDGGISIILFPNRIEIWNPGSLPPGMTVDDLETGGVSRPHNPDIANVFLLRGLIERAGIGASRMIRECISAGLHPPRWVIRAGGIHLTLYLSPTQESAENHTNERMNAFLEESAEGSEITLRVYSARYALGVSQRTARSDLRQMTDMGLLQRFGQDRNARYRRTAMIPKSVLTTKRSV